LVSAHREIHKESSATRERGINRPQGRTCESPDVLSSSHCDAGFVPFNKTAGQGGAVVPGPGQQAPMGRESDGWKEHPARHTTPAGRSRGGRTGGRCRRRGGARNGERRAGRRRGHEAAARSRRFLCDAWAAGFAVGLAVDFLTGRKGCGSRLCRADGSPAPVVCDGLLGPGLLLKPRKGGEDNRQSRSLPWNTLCWGGGPVM